MVFESKGLTPKYSGIRSYWIPCPIPAASPSCKAAQGTSGRASAILSKIESGNGKHFVCYESILTFGVKL